MTNYFRKPDALVDAVRSILSGQPVQEKKMDPVDQKALKGKHSDRKDKDIDNDGDVDSSDEYLHKRRQAVSKAMKEATSTKLLDKFKKGDKVTINVASSSDREMRDLKKELGDTIGGTVIGQTGVHLMVKTEKGQINPHVKDVIKESVTDAYHKEMLKALGKSKLPKGHQYTSAIASNGDFVVYDGGKRIVGRLKKGEHSIKEGVEDNPANTQHLCAKNVVHESWGEGSCIPTMHADPDEEGNVAWYDVMFDHGIEEQVSIEELKVTKAESHIHSSYKKKIKESKDEYEDDDDDSDEDEKNGKKKKVSGKKDDVDVEPEMDDAKMVAEKEMTPAQEKKREEIVLSMKKEMPRFKKKYGDRAKDVMYATATKMAMKEGFELGIEKSDLIEEVELDEAKIAKKVPAKDGGHFVVLHRDTSGMRGTQDKFHMRHHLKNGKVKDYGTHPSMDGALKFAKNRGIIEEVKLDEAKIKEFKKGDKVTIKVAKSIEPEMQRLRKELGDTISGTVIGQLGTIVMVKTAKGQVNPHVKDVMKEEVELDEAKMYAIGYHFLHGLKNQNMKKSKDFKTKKEAEKAANNIVRAKGGRAEVYANMFDPDGRPGHQDYPKLLKTIKEETELDEGRGRPRKDGTTGGNEDRENIQMQLRKSVSLRGLKDVEFADGNKVKVPAKVAQGVMSKINSIKDAKQKQNAVQHIAKSHKHMMDFHKGDYKDADAKRQDILKLK